MIGISGRSFNWVGTPWAQTHTWRVRQQAANDGFLNIAASVSDIFAQASYGFASGMANLAAQAALKRIQGQAAAKQAGVQSGLNKQV